MALTITKTDTLPLTIKGTSVVLPSVYARLETAFSPNGINIQIGMYFYENKAAFQSEEGVVKIKELKSLYNKEADLAADPAESQTVELAHEKVKADLEAKGYTVAIVDL
jgi:hypothetical protein